MKNLCQFLAISLICAFLSACDPPYHDTEIYIKNMSSYSVTISNYSFDGVISKSNLGSIVIPAGTTKLVGIENGSGSPSEIDGIAYISWFFCPDGAEILFEDGIALRFDPDNLKGGKNSIYSVSSYEYEILRDDSHAKCTYVITDEDHDGITEQ